MNHNCLLYYCSGVTRLAEVFRSKDDGWLDNLPDSRDAKKAPIVALGYKLSTIPVKQPQRQAANINGE
jgi:hypothetical protein